MGRALLLALAASLAGAAPAGAAPPAVDVQRFESAWTPGDGFGLRGTRTLALRRFAAGATLSYAHRPLVMRRADGTDLDGVRHLLTLDLQAAIGFGPVDLGLAFPLHLLVAGAGMPGWGEAHRSVEAGDLRIAPRVRILDVERLGFGLGVAVPITLPTGAEGRFVGRGTPTVAPTLLLEGRLGRLGLQGNLGGRFGGPAEGAEAFTGSSVLLGFGASLELHPALAVLAEARAEIHPGSPEGASAEWSAGLLVRPAPWMELRVAGGTGLAPGVGTPEFRVLGGVAFSPSLPAERPVEPEPVAAAEPTERTVLVELPPGAWVEVGHPDCTRLEGGAEPLALSLGTGAQRIEVGAEGYVTRAIDLPAGGDLRLPPVELEPLPAEGRVELLVRDAEGAVVGARAEVEGAEPQRTDAAGRARLRLPAGSHRVRVEGPEHEPRELVVEVEPGVRSYQRVRLPRRAAPSFPERIYFRVGSASLDAAGSAVVAAVGARAAELRAGDRLVIVGMADPTGSAGANRALALRRSRVVAEALTAAGVPPEILEQELEPVGPASGAQSPERAAEMRRVEFRLRAAVPHPQTDTPPAAAGATP